MKKLLLRHILCATILLTAIAAQALPYEVIFDFSRGSSPAGQDRDWYFGERQPGNTFDDNNGTTNLIVSNLGYLTAATKTNAWILLNDTSPNSINYGPTNANYLSAGTNLTVRTRFENLTSSTGSEDIFGGILFGVTAPGDALAGPGLNGFLARIDRGLGTSQVAVDRIENGIRVANLGISTGSFTYGGNTVPYFMELKVTSDGVTTNATVKFFTDAVMNTYVASGSNTIRLTDPKFETETPVVSVTVALTTYGAGGLLGLWCEDNASTNALNPSAGAVRYSNFYAKSGTLPPNVALSASLPLAYENGADGAFQISRTNTSGTLAVNYTLSGTATNGVDYITLGGTVTFADTQASVSVPVSAIDNSLAEAPRSVILTIVADEAYAVVGNSSGTVTIVDDEPPVFVVIGNDTNAYEATSFATASLSIARPLGNPNASVTVNYSFSGTAVLGTDYVSSATNTLSFAPGVTSQSIIFTPASDALTNGDRSIIMTITAGSGYSVDEVAGNGTALIVDDELPAETILWSDNFDTGASATNYAILAASREGTVEDYTTDFAFDYNLAGIPAPPSSSSSLGFKLTANKDSLNYSAAFNAFLTNQNQTFSGNYALRLDLYANYGTLNSEQVLFGINCSGTVTNWRSSSYSNTFSGDGIWASINVSDSFSASLIVGTNVVATMAPPTSLNYFHSPPYSVAGTIGNTDGSASKTWVRAELSQQGSLVTLRLNNSVLLYTNQTSYTSGKIMMGYNDLFDSTGSASGFAVIDNVRVVQLPATSAPQISDINVTGSTVQVDFTAEAGDVVGNFKLQSRGSLSSGSFADDNTAVITSLGGGNFRATTTSSGDMQFYQVKRL